MNQTNSERPDEVDEPVRLDDGALPCGVCGCAVMAPDPRTVEKAEMVRDNRATVVLVAKCLDCAERERTAGALAHRYLCAGVTCGDRRYSGTDAVRLLVAAREASAAAGMEPLPVERASRPGTLLALEIVHLGGLIRGLRWPERLSPPTSLVAAPIRLVDPGTANARPWAHLDDEDRARLCTGVAKVLSERLALQAPDVDLMPPALEEQTGHRGIPVTAGCLYCGVREVRMTALAVARHGGVDAAARSVWTQRQVNAAALGGHRSASLILGWLCPPCEAAAVSEGSANSVGALEAALSAFLGVSRRTLAGDELWVTGLQGWGALVANALRRDRPLPSANAEPWGHLSRAERDALANEWRLGGSTAMR